MLGVIVDKVGEDRRVGERRVKVKVRVRMRVRIMRIMKIVDDGAGAAQRDSEDDYYYD